ncbi:zinc ribbon domain-containing protein [Paenibacillus sp. NPDC056579]|uniref:zinc ribbon domain-containing protein n=1 Tax=unclassified Paenibacillus TaxID=185978 RepID=UPI001EF955B7|nr:zinc ribbon domain-containing protein [Paenibacillus sp. H1-7]ULL18056.1 zinc ribbon domain-containing protein [Paenibacillus sp. H1-7]
MSFFDKMKQGASEAAKKAQQTVEMTKLRTQIASKEKEIEKAFTLIGESIYQSHTAGNWKSSERDVAAYCDHIALLKQGIQALEVKIKLAKNEKECRCGKVVASDVKFCPVCGFQFQDFQRTEESDEAVQVMCRSCKNYNEMDAKFCAHCGVVI